MLLSAAVLCTFAVSPAPACRAQVKQDESLTQEERQAAGERPSPTGRAAVRIDGEDVTFEEIAAWLLLEHGPGSADEFALVKGLEHLARERGVSVDDAAVERNVDEDLTTRIERAFGGDREAWLAEVHTLGRTVVGIRTERFEAEHTDALARAIVALDWQVGEDAVRRDFEYRYGPDGRGVVVQAIYEQLVLPAVKEGETRAEIEARRKVELEKLHGRLSALRDQALGGASFDELARKHSMHEASRAEGGLLPGVVRRKDWSPDVLASILALEEGEISEPLDARGGSWIFRAVSVTDTPYSEVRDAIVERLKLEGPGEIDLRALLDRVLATTEIDYPSESVARDPLTALRDGSMRVGDAVVPLHEYGRWLVRTSIEAYVREFATQRALERLATERGLSYTEEEIERRVDDEILWTLDMGYQGSKEKWLQSLAGSNLDEAEWRREARRRARRMLAAEEMVMEERVVTEQDVRDLYAETYGVDGEPVDARFITIDLELAPQGDDEPREAFVERAAPAIAAVADRVAEIVERHDEGEDFGALAERYSSDLDSAKNGGRPRGAFDAAIYPADVSEGCARSPSADSALRSSSGRASTCSR
ncbi:MAG: peptidylprolyl isomerase [Planctomycetota bacterium]